MSDPIKLLLVVLWLAGIVAGILGWRDTLHWGRTPRTHVVRGAMQGMVAGCALSLLLAAIWWFR